MSAVADIFAHWAPPLERTRLVSSIRFGAICGVAINYPVSGYVAHHWGWQAIFYQSGKQLLLQAVPTNIFLNLLEALNSETRKY